MKEYKVINTRLENLEKSLNKLVKQGWEVVTMAKSRTAIHAFCVILVREISQNKEKAEKIVKKYVPGDKK